MRRAAALLVVLAAAATAGVAGLGTAGGTQGHHSEHRPAPDQAAAETSISKGKYDWPSDHGATRLRRSTSVGPR